MPSVLAEIRNWDLLNSSIEYNFCSDLVNDLNPSRFKYSNSSAILTNIYCSFRVSDQLLNLQKMQVKFEL